MRKATEYIMSTLLTLKKLKTKNTALTILYKALNTTSRTGLLSCRYVTQTAPETAKPKCIPTPPPSIEDLHTWKAEDKEEPGNWNCTATDYMVKKLGHWKAD